MNDCLRYSRYHLPRLILENLFCTYCASKFHHHTALSLLHSNVITVDTPRVPIILGDSSRSIMSSSNSSTPTKSQYQHHIPRFVLRRFQIEGTQKEYKYVPQDQCIPFSLYDNHQEMLKSETKLTNELSGKEFSSRTSYFSTFPPNQSRSDPSQLRMA